MSAAHPHRLGATRTGPGRAARSGTGIGGPWVVVEAELLVALIRRRC
jgi:hypothetical protein